MCVSPVRRSPPSFASVFLLMDGDKYTYSFDGAAAACRTLNATVATLVQMEQALQRGLETCKYVDSTGSKFSPVPGDRVVVFSCVALKRRGSGSSNK